MVYLIGRTKEYDKGLDTTTSQKLPLPLTAPGKKSTAAATIHEKIGEYEGRIKQLEKECEGLHHDNYRLAQEIQYLEFKLKVRLEMVISGRTPPAAQT